ncbi:MAG: DNA-directed RNA polymerase subunit beta', partial [Candidatus Pacebacteria bacterium]|nr:DNA-directed RNA polymerase subunit beta' [Candidatus Paceibacterota bacterium]
AMAVHVPLTPQAQMEAREIMSANKNILKPGSGEPIVMSKLLDIVLGCYWMTQELPGLKGEGKAFPSTNAAITAYDFGDVDFRAKIRVMPSENAKYAAYEGKVFETTIGRLLFNAALPNDFPYIDEEITSKKMRSLVTDLVKRYGLSGIPGIINKVKNFGFTYATRAGITWSYSDISVPPEKEALVKEGQDAVSELWRQYNEGLLTETERTRLAIETWTNISDRVKKALMEKLQPTSPVHNMVTSGARGSAGNLHQMVGMKGLITNPRGEVIEFPIIASMKEGLSPIEYFISTHGARKGMSDTALNTAKAGYLTRRLFDVAQDVIILEADCGTKEGVVLKRPGKDSVGGSLVDKLAGRILAQGVEAAGLKRNHLILPADARKIDEAGLDEVVVRSPMTCETMRGICQHCYGIDMTTQEMVDVGEAVGVVAAQAIGEPGTQLTMRTFHQGGVAAAGGDITMGLPRVEEVFERRKPKVPAIIAHVDAVVTSIIKDGTESVITLAAQGKSAKRDLEYRVHPARTIIVKQGQSVTKGQFMTDGSANLEELFDHAGKSVTQEYVIDEITRIYEMQGVTISRKHLELIVKQMFSRIEITNSGDTKLSIGKTVEDYEFQTMNKEAKAKGQESSKGAIRILGIAEVSLTRTSFLSSVSFQHSTKKLVEASLAGAVDKLIGLKENVIIGRLIPAGTGFPGSKKHAMISALEKQMFAESDESESRE